VLIDLFPEGLLIEGAVVGGDISDRLFQLFMIGQADMGVEGMDFSGDDHRLQSKLCRLVFVLEFGGFDFVGHVKTVDAIAESLHGLDHLTGSQSGGVEEDVLVGALKQELCSVGGVPKSPRAGFEVDDVVFRLFSLLVHEVVLADRVNRHIEFINRLEKILFNTTPG
jgi:hypothetical protein